MNKEQLRKVFEDATNPDQTLSALMAVLGEGLSCARCLLFLREPHSRKTKMTHQWVAAEEHFIVRDTDGWEIESPTLPDEDPMYREALNNPQALYIDDIETAPGVNASFEREHFGHTALVHAPIHHDGLMYGIIEPCVFDGPRVWDEEDRALIKLAQQLCVPTVIEYIREHCP